MQFVISCANKVKTTSLDLTTTNIVTTIKPINVSRKKVENEVIDEKLKSVFDFFYLSVKLWATQSGQLSFAVNQKVSGALRKVNRLNNAETFQTLAW